MPNSRVPRALFAALAVLLLPSLAVANSAPVVTNVTATQIPNTGQVRITFDVSDADGDLVTARVIVSSNNGATFDLLPVALSGDANHQMAAGPGKQVIWDAGRDFPGRYWTQVVAKVICSDGPATSGEMVFVPAGTFTMGKDGLGFSPSQPEHLVTLDAFYIDKFEVTNAEFEQFMLAGGYNTPAFWSPSGWAWRAGNGIDQPYVWNSDTYHCGAAYPGFPVVGISYYEAEAYANFAGKRLPTEAEWEKAARGNDGRDFPWGNYVNYTLANYNGSLDPYGTTTPVGYYDGSFHPYDGFQTANGAGPYGTYDQAGNAVEWVRDWYGAYGASPVTNPTGPPTGVYRVLRGGGFSTQECGGIFSLSNQVAAWWRWDSPFLVGCAYAYPSPDFRREQTGFRCARSAN